MNETEPRYFHPNEQLFLGGFEIYTILGTLPQYYANGVLELITLMGDLFHQNLCEKRFRTFRFREKEITTRFCTVTEALELVSMSSLDQNGKVVFPQIIEGKYRVLE